MAPEQQTATLGAASAPAAAPGWEQATAAPAPITWEPQAPPAPPPQPIAPARPRALPRRRRRPIDLVAGILLGVALGLAVIAAFLAFGSESTIDAPSVDHHGARSAPATQAPAGGPARE